MFLRHKDTRWALALTLGLAAAQALATETRVGVLRNNGGIDDETRVFTYPGQISKYRVALVELGEFSSFSKNHHKAYGAAMADVNGVSMGVALSREDWLFTGSWLGKTTISSAAVSLFDAYEKLLLDDASATPSPYLYRPARPIEFLLGFDVGGGTLGLRLAFAEYKNKTDSTAGSVNDKKDYSAQHSQLGVGFHMGTFDLAMTLDPSASQKRSETSNSLESSTSVKGSSLSIDGRWVGDENVSSFYAKGKVANRSFKASGSASGRDFSSKFSDQLIVLEGGYVARKDAKGPKLFTGVEFLQNSSKGPTIAGTAAKPVPSYASNDESAKLDTTVVSGTLSGEADVAGGFGVLAGLHYVLLGDVTLKDNTTNQNMKTVVSFPETSDYALWSLGVSYKVDALRIDASYDKVFLYNGPYLIAGNQTSPMVSRISASYAF